MVVVVEVRDDLKVADSDLTFERFQEAYTNLEPSCAHLEMVAESIVMEEGQEVAVAEDLFAIRFVALSRVDKVVPLRP